MPSTSFVRLLRTRRHLNGIYISKTFSTSRKSYGENQNSSQSPLRVFNSLTKSKTSIEAGVDQPLKWYSCGPTVYDASHLGHARNYVSQDIIRRILTNFFGYDVHFVMNVTDIDDKIVARTRENFFLERFISQHEVLSDALIIQILELLQDYVHSYITTSFKSAPSEIEAVLGRLSSVLSTRAWGDSHLQKEENLEMQLSSARRCFDSIVTARAQLIYGAAEREYVLQLINASREVLGPALNSKFKSEMIDPALYKQTASVWEARFFQDLSRLNVLPPDRVTRASEHIPEIVNFIEGIMKGGYAYSSNGSVYFDTHAFNESGDRQSHKLLAVNKTLCAIQNGTVPRFRMEKKSPSDFSLWKAAKPGEPSWASPWGAGRPGWHIECSAMASSVFGDNLHIHSGGIDLLFPHHTNELAQSEAYHGCKEWVNCFIHVGHLHINGRKMSKSLKNFITIEQLLITYSARQIRLAFLIRPWDARLEFSDDIMTKEVIPLEAFLDNFFSHVSSLSRDDATFLIGHAFGAHERDLRLKFDHAKVLFRNSLGDSINTASAINAIRTLISQTHVYISANPVSVDGLLLLAIARWISEMLRMFGLTSEPQFQSIWEMPSSPTQGETSNAFSASLPYLEALSSYRDAVRKIAKEKSPSMVNDLLVLSDQLRDDVLPPLSVQLGDRADGSALIKWVPAGSSTREKVPISRPEASGRSFEEWQKLSPHDMFRPPHVVGFYSSWDESGVPVTDAEGVDLSKTRRRKLQKAWTRQKALYDLHHKAKESE